jgi:hypothetical protein
VSPPRQGVFLWEIPNTPELLEAVQAGCRELLSQMLLAAVTSATETQNRGNVRIGHNNSSGTLEASSTSRFDERIA